MNHKVLKKLIASSVAISALLTLVPMKASAEWVKNYYGNWKYTEGSSYATGWRTISGTWYFFDYLGQMRTGWIYDGGETYYAGLSGAMQTGVIQIEGKIYLFAENGALQKGECIINGKIYNFDDNGLFIGTDSPIPTNGFDYYGNSTIPYVPSQIISGDVSMSSDIPSDGSKQVNQYKVKFKDPYVEDTDEELLKTRTIDEGTKMLLYKPTKSGYTFVEWNTASGGDGTSYYYDDSIKINKNITLYAQWEIETDTSIDTEIIKVTSITVSGSGSIIQIKTQEGNLQMTKKVAPSDSTNQKVVWSVVNVTGEAVISSTGLLTAVSNGTVTVKATATDGSGVIGTFTVSISGQ